MGKKIETLSHITTVFQNIAIIFSLVFGGWWAIKTFTHENPSFQEIGVFAAGYQADEIIADMTIDKLAENEMYYEVTIEVTNRSKNFTQVIPAKWNNFLISRITSNTNRSKGELVSLNIVSEVSIPPSSTKKFRALISFPEKGIYLVEYNPCSENGSDCSIRKYISIEKANKANSADAKSSAAD